MDKAVQRKLTVRTLQDLEQTIQLCEKALQKGLDAGNTEFANELLAATLFERATGISQRVFRGNLPGPQWATARQYALTSLERSLNLDPRNGEAYLLTARLHALPAGDPQKAMTALDKAGKLFDDDKVQLSKVMLLRASVAENDKDRRAALDESINLDPRHLDAWRARGLYQLQRRDADAAIADFLKLLEIKPDDLAALQMVAQVFFTQDKLDEAIEHITRAIEVIPGGSSPAFTLRAAVHARRNALDKAVEDLDRAIQIQPSNIAALMMRGRIRQQQGDFDLAVQDSNRVIQLAPGRPDALLMRSLLLGAMGNLSEAIKDLAKLVQLNPDSVDLRLRLAAFCVQDQRPRRAIQIYTEALHVDPEHGGALRGRADALLSIGKHVEAIKDYESALAKDPQDESRAGILNNLAWVLATSPLDDVRDGARSTKLATEACEATNYEAAHILSTLAAGYAESDDFETAQNWSSKAIEQAKKDLESKDLSEAIRKHFEDQLVQLEKEMASYLEQKKWRELVETKEKNEHDLPSTSDLDDSSPPESVEGSAP